MNPFNIIAVQALWPLHLLKLISIGMSLSLATRPYFCFPTFSLSLWSLLLRSLLHSALTMGSEIVNGLPIASLLHHCPGLWSFLLLFFFLPTGKSLFIKRKLHRTLKWRSAPALTAISTTMGRLLQTPRRGSLNAQHWFSGRCSKEKRDRLQHRRTSGTD